MMAEDSSNAEVFVYTGEVGAVVPQDVVRVRVDPSVTSIPAQAFIYHKKLAEVKLCEGVVEIGERSFGLCDHSIRRINIPNSLRRVKDFAFSFSLRTPIRLHDGIESIGRYSFSSCIFTNFRVPPLITIIPDNMLAGCTTIFSVELSEHVRDIKIHAFFNCHCLRNVSFPHAAVFGDDRIFHGVTDLFQLFGSIAEMISELQHRFDGLPIHKLVYYQSYNLGKLQNLVAAINTRSGQRWTLRSKLDPTGNQQDCVGMTPLHILACSSSHDLEMYRVIVERYPANLITEDRWGALPLLHAFWGAAPAEIIDFLLESYQSLYPRYKFNWTMMVQTMGRTDTPKENIEKVLHVRLMHFHDQTIDWEYLLDEFVKPSDFYMPGVPLQERMHFLVTCGLSMRVEALPFKIWRDRITTMIQTSNFEYNGDNSIILREIRDKLVFFEDELPKLKEATTMLELALWKKRINDTNHQQKMARSRKKIKIVESSTQQQDSVTCGADVVIGRVLPFLIAA
jgi:hypothetical protein